MGKQSIRENKTIYQLCREAAGLTRAEASEKMNAVSASKIEKFEYETQEPTLYDILQMADAYKRPDLCNYYCSQMRNRLSLCSRSRSDQSVKYHFGDNCQCELLGN